MRSRGEEIEEAANRLTVEAFDYFTLRGLIPTPGIVEAVGSLDRALARPAEEARPVAWGVVHPRMSGMILCPDEARAREVASMDDDRVVPLYTSPAPSGQPTSAPPAPAEDVREAARMCISAAMMDEEEHERFESHVLHRAGQQFPGKDVSRLVARSEESHAHYQNTRIQARWEGWLGAIVDRSLPLPTGAKEREACVVACRNTALSFGNAPAGCVVSPQDALAWVLNAGNALLRAEAGGSK